MTWKLSTDTDQTWFVVLGEGGDEVALFYDRAPAELAVRLHNAELAHSKWLVQLQGAIDEDLQE